MRGEGGDAAMCGSKELIAAIGVLFVITGSWFITPGFGLMVIGMIILMSCTYFGSEGN